MVVIKARSILKHHRIVLGHLTFHRNINNRNVLLVSLGSHIYSVVLRKRSFDCFKQKVTRNIVDRGLCYE